MRLALLTSALLLISACTNPQTNVPVVIDRTVGRTADPAPVTMLPVNFRVVTKDTVQTFVQELEREQGNSPVFIGITTRDYENIVINLADLRRYIEQQQAIIIYYQQLSSSREQSN